VRAPTKIRDANITGAGDISLRTKNGIFALAQLINYGNQIISFYFSLLYEAIISDFVLYIPHLSPHKRSIRVYFSLKVSINKAIIIRHVWG